MAFLLKLGYGALLLLLCIRNALKILKDMYLEAGWTEDGLNQPPAAIK